MWGPSLPEVYGMDARYMDLFALPYVEFAPAYRSFGFSNPVIRILDLREFSEEDFAFLEPLSVARPSAHN